MHSDDHTCDCGTHGHHCDQAANPHHTHDENCNCGHHHAPIVPPEGLTAIQPDFLLALRQRQCLPIARFCLQSSKDEELFAVALSPVYLSKPDESMEQAKAYGRALAQLEAMDLLTLDYDIPLRHYPYREYHTSELYAYFVQTTAEAALLPDAAFDTPCLELGSMALTEAGENEVDELLAQL